MSSGERKLAEGEQNAHSLVEIALHVRIRNNVDGIVLQRQLHWIIVGSA